MAHEQITQSSQPFRGPGTVNNRHPYRHTIYPTYTGIYSPEAMHPDWSPTTTTADAILARLANWLPGSSDSAILDVACGTGNLLYAVGRAGYKNLHGVDISEEQVSVARRILASVVRADVIDYLHDHPGEFDVITAIDIIEHFDKNEALAFVDALFSALKPGGRLILQTPNATSPFFGSVRHGDFTHEIAFTPQSLEGILQLVGFEGYQARECVPYVHGFKSGLRAALWAVLRQGLVLWNYIETGTSGGAVFTRVFMAKVDKPV